MKISIAMATYNGGAFLREQLDSLSSQTRRPDELVITDDQSTDNTLAIAQDFSKSAPFTVRIECNSHRLGITNNFSKALSLCTGELIMLCDQDDIWMPEKIAVLEQIAHQNSDKACFVSDAALADETLVPSGASKREQILASGLPEEAMVMGCCATFRRELMQLLLPIPMDPQGFDGWLVHFSDLMNKTLRLDLQLQLYRRHDNNASNIFVNRLEPLSTLDVLRKRILDLPRRFSSGRGLVDEQEFYSLAAERMTERSAAMIELVGAESAASTRLKTEARLNLLVCRQRIRGEPIRRRAPMILRLLLDGGYRLSGHAFGAAKDFFFSPR